MKNSPKIIVIKNSTKATNKQTYLFIGLGSLMSSISFTSWILTLYYFHSSLLLLLIISLCIPILFGTYLVAVLIFRLKYRKLRRSLQEFCQRTSLLKLETSITRPTQNVKFKVSRDKENDLDYIEYFPRGDSSINLDEFPNKLSEVLEDLDKRPWILKKSKTTRVSLLMVFSHIEDERLKFKGSSDYADNKFN